MKTYYLAFIVFVLAGLCSFFACQESEVVEVSAEMTQAEKVKRGEYLVTIAGCNDCHTPKIMTPEGPKLDLDRLLSGHRSDEQLAPVDLAAVGPYALFNGSLTAAIGPWGTSFSANLTSDESGIGNWTEEQFERAVREGKSKGLANNRALLPPMPWENLVHLTDEDLSAIFAYLKSTKPVRNVVPAPIPPANLSMN